MQLLAERMQWNLYTPIGHEWWDAGIWRFGEVYGDDRLAQQYLSIGEQWEQDSGFRWTYDSEFPAAAIDGVTLEQAKVMEWAYVIPTVQENQRGFAKFAREVGAAYVYQVGNTGQYIDWSLDPLVLNSSEMPILGRGIRYHQEMDPIAARFREPFLANSAQVSSFVNCFPQIRAEVAYIGGAWDEARTLLPRWTFLEHGIDGAEGILKPIGLIADTMALSTFIWHDKPQGDGFGHVIHGAAAVGRPIVGHAHHYRGRMAQYFWTPQTSIDLDSVSVPDAVKLMQEIAQDRDRHAEMCHAIRAIYDRIDYDGEARVIADFLDAKVPVLA